MKIDSFLRNVSALKTTAGITGQPFAMGMYGERLASDNILSLSVKIDNIIVECNELIDSHMKAKKIIEDYGKQTAGNKSNTAKKLEDNNKKRLNLEAEVKGLEPEIRYYEEKEDERIAENTRLKTYSRQIDERNNSSNKYIPFYGIKYVIETNDMIHEYNRRVKDWNELNDWLNKNRSRWHEQKSRFYFLKSEIESLRQENDELQKEGGKICELLTILSSLIAELQSFLAGINSARNDLSYTFVKNAQQAQTLIDSALTKISGYNDILQKKLVEYSDELPVGIMQEIKLLVG